MMAILGGDCGLDGGYAILDLSGNILLREIMPCVETRRRKEVNVIELRNGILGSMNDHNITNLVCFIEWPGGSKNAKTAASMASSFTAFRSVIQLTENMRLIRITPQDWQNSLLGKFPAGESKIYAERYCSKRWPDVDLRKSGRSKNAHEGIVDALCIADYGLKNIKELL